MSIGRTAAKPTVGNGGTEYFLSAVALAEVDVMGAFAGAFAVAGACLAAVLAAAAGRGGWAVPWLAAITTVVTRVRAAIPRKPGIFPAFMTTTLTGFFWLLATGYRILPAPHQ